MFRPRKKLAALVSFLVPQSLRLQLKGLRAKVSKPNESQPEAPYLRPASPHQPRELVKPEPTVSLEIPQTEVQTAGSQEPPSTLQPRELAEPEPTAPLEVPEPELHTVGPETPLRTLESLDADVFRLIALELRRGKKDLVALASCSRALRDLTSPTLFYRCRRHNGKRYLPPRIRPFIQHLVFCGPLEGRAVIHYFDTVLNCLPSLSAITLEQTSHIPWEVIMACSSRPNIESLTLSKSACFAAGEPDPIAAGAGGPIVLASFSLEEHPWREMAHRLFNRHNGRAPLKVELAREIAYLSALVPRMRETVRQLTLPMESAPILSMADLDWPMLRSLTIHGRYLDDTQAESLPVLLNSLPQLLRLSVKVGRFGDIHRPPILGSHLPRRTTLCGLRSLTVAYPDPDDAIFHVGVGDLRHLSLGDCPRYYNEHCYEGMYQPGLHSPILSSAECLSILQKMAMPYLSSLEVVYLADKAGSDDALLTYISTNFPLLVYLELHRYRANREEEVDHIHITELLTAAQSLRIVRLNVDFLGDHGPYCANRLLRDEWFKTFKKLGWEIVDVMQRCPLLERVELLYHGLPDPLWVEFHPARCAEPRFVMQNDAEHIDSELMPYPWTRGYMGGPLPSGPRTPPQPRARRGRGRGRGAAQS